MIREVINIDKYQYFRLNYDSNGNARTVICWPGLGFASYAEAVAELRKLGGKAYRGREIGGGIVFQESPASLAELLRVRGIIKGDKR